MDARTLLMQLLRAPHTHRTLLAAAPARPTTRTAALSASTLAFPAHTQARHLTVPRILQPSFWTSMIPRPFRPGSTADLEADPEAPQSQSQSQSQSKPKRESNPATPYIVLGLLVGSQAIQILWLKQEREAERRRSEALVGRLKDVVGRLQRGEGVGRGEVREVLGVGDAEVEADWEDVIRERKREELFPAKEAKAKLKREEAERKAEEALRALEAEAKRTDNVVTVEEAGDGKVKVEVVKGARFY